MHEPYQPPLVEALLYEKHGREDTLCVLPGGTGGNVHNSSHQLKGLMTG